MLYVYTPVQIPREGFTGPYISDYAGFVFRRNFYFIFFNLNFSRPIQCASCSVYRVVWAGWRMWGVKIMFQNWKMT